MKKNTIIAAIAAASALLLCASCQKQELVEQNNGNASGKTFTATIEQSLTKTTITNEYKVNWVEGDQININGSIFSATPDASDSTKASLTKVSGLDPTPDYTAVYPASIMVGTQATLPATQTYAAGKFNAPMCAMSSTETLEFKNFCGVLCFALKGTDTVKSIAVTANEQLCGPFEFADATSISFTGENEGYTVTLDCGEGVQLSSTDSTNFYVYLPPKDSYTAGMKIVVTSTEGKTFEKTTTTAVKIERNNLYTFDWTASFSPATTGTAKATIGGSEVDVKWTQLWPDGPKFAEYNVGASSATDYGHYLAWGGSSDKDATYNAGSADLSGSDDSAYKVWGEHWRMPTEGELQGLLDNCDVQWTDDYNGTGKAGRIFTGKGDYISNGIFLPAAGYNDGNVSGQGSIGYYWSSTPCGSDDAYSLGINSGGQLVDYCSRYYGCSVRPIYVEDLVAVTGVSLNKTELKVGKGNTETLSATVAPADATNKKVLWTSSDEKVATVDAYGKVTGVASGQCVITATTEDGGKTATCEVEVAVLTTGTAKRTGDIDVNWVQLWENGPKFAECNIGADKATDYGHYLAWGGSSDKDATYNAGSADLSGSDDSAYKVWGEHWRMPTEAEFSTLMNNCTCTWTTNYNKTGVNGLLCTGKGDYISNSIFLPIAGLWIEGQGVSTKSYKEGWYWSSTKTTDVIDKARCIHIKNTTTGTTSEVISAPRKNGYFVRPIYVKDLVAVTGVSLNNTTLRFGKGNTKTLSATVAPAEATNKKVLWTSSNEKVATVDANGKVTGVALGKCDITATTEDGNKTATCEVEVAVLVTGVTLNKTTLKFGIGDTETLSATVAPANATNKKVLWTSSNEKVATVDANGKVTGVALGKCDIKATTEDGGKTATCAVEVVVPTTGTATAKINGKNVDVKWVQLWPDGPKFAEYNVGASSVAEIGTEMKFADAIAENWGQNWCTPSKDQMDELEKATSSESNDRTNSKVICQYTQVSGVYGFKFTGKETGYTSNSVFFPAKQSAAEGYSSTNGIVGCWSATPESPTSARAWRMCLYRNKGKWDGDWFALNKTSYKYFVRPVLKN